MLHWCVCVCVCEVVWCVCVVCEGVVLHRAQVLLGAGADRDLADSEGRTAVNYAALLGEGGEAVMSLLQTADTIASPSCPDRESLLGLPSHTHTLTGRPATTATTVPPPLSPLHSPSTHSLPSPPPSSAPLIQHTDDPSKVCTLL